MQTFIPSPLTQVTLIAASIYGLAICIWLIKLIAIDKAVVSPLIFLYPLMVLTIYVEFAVKAVYKYLKYLVLLACHNVRIRRRLYRLYVKYCVKSAYYYLLLAYKAVYIVVRHIINLFIR